MKIVIVFISACLFLSTVYAQTIEGIGDFRIGMSAKEFLENTSMTEKRILTNEKPSVLSFPYFDAFKNISIHSPDIEEYDFVTQLGIKDISGNDNYRMKATLFKGSLVSINVTNANPNFIEIVTEKYGKPKHEDSAKIEKCQNIYSAITEHRDGKQSYIWGEGAGKDVVAKYYENNFSCSSINVQNYAVYSLRGMAEVNAIIGESIIKIKSEELRNKVGKSKL